MKNTFSIVVAGLMATLVFAATYATKIPVPVAGGGYVNCGDIVIYVSGFLLGPFAALPAAIGSGLSDLVGGYGIYVIPTVIIKGLMGFLAGSVLTKRRNLMGFIVTGVLCGAVMTFGYSVFEFFTLGFAAAIAGIPFNCVQWATGFAAAALYPFWVQVDIQYKKAQRVI